MAACARDLAAQRQGFRMKIEERQGQKIPDEDLGWGDLDEAFPARPAPRWDAILQPPKPQITPSYYSRCFPICGHAAALRGALPTGWWLHCVTSFLVVPG
jgi:hypothetical protein